MSLTRKIAAWSVACLFAGAFAALAGAFAYASVWMFLNSSLGGALFWTSVFLAVLGFIGLCTGNYIWGDD